MPSPLSPRAPEGSRKKAGVLGLKTGFMNTQALLEEVKTPQNQVMPLTLESFLILVCLYPVAHNCLKIWVPIRHLNKTHRRGIPDSAG